MEYRGHKVVYRRLPMGGVWCDYGMYELSDVEDDCIIHSGWKQFRWEMRRRSEEGSI